MEVKERRLHSSLRERVEGGRGGRREEEEEDGGIERLRRKVYSSSGTLKAFENHHVLEINSGKMLNKHSAGLSSTSHKQPEISHENSVTVSQVKKLINKSSCHYK